MSVFVIDEKATCKVVVFLKSRSNKSKKKLFWTTNEYDRITNYIFIISGQTLQLCFPFGKLLFKKLYVALQGWISKALAITIIGLTETCKHGSCLLHSFCFSCTLCIYILLKTMIHL